MAPAVVVNTRQGTGLSPEALQQPAGAAPPLPPTVSLASTLPGSSQQPRAGPRAHGHVSLARQRHQLLRHLRQLARARRHVSILLRTANGGMAVWRGVGAGQPAWRRANGPAPKGTSSAVGEAVESCTIQLAARRCLRQLGRAWREGLGTAGACRPTCRKWKVTESMTTSRTAGWAARKLGSSSTAASCATWGQQAQQARRRRAA